MNWTKQDNGNYLPKNVNIVNNAKIDFKKSPEEKAKLKKLKQQSKYYMMFRNKTLKPFANIG